MSARLLGRTLQRQVAHVLSKGGGVLWTPAALGSAVSAWWDAQTPGSITLNGSNVSSWASRGAGGNAVQATGANQPVYSPTGFDGSRPAITFDGTNDVLTAALPTIAQPMSVFAAIANYVGGIGDANLYRAGTTGAVGYRASGVATWSIFAGAVRSIAGAYTTAACLRHDVYNGASSEIRRDGTQYDLGNAGGNGFPAGPFYLASNNSNTTANASVKMGEFLIFNRTLTTDERRRVEGYAAWRWGIQANLPSGHPYKDRAPYV